MHAEEPDPDPDDPEPDDPEPDDPEPDPEEVIEIGNNQNNW